MMYIVHRTKAGLEKSKVETGAAASPSCTRGLLVQFSASAPEQGTCTCNVAQTESADSPAGTC